MQLQRGATFIDVAEIIPCEPETDNADEGICDVKKHLSQFYYSLPYLYMNILRKRNEKIAIYYSL